MKWGPRHLGFNANKAIYRDEDLPDKGKEHIAALSHLFFFGLLGGEGPIFLVCGR